MLHVSLLMSPFHHVSSAAGQRPAECGEEAMRTSLNRVTECALYHYIRRVSLSNLREQTRTIPRALPRKSAQFSWNTLQLRWNLCRRIRIRRGCSPGASCWIIRYHASYTGITWSACSGLFKSDYGTEQNPLFMASQHRKIMKSEVLENKREIILTTGSQFLSH
jgi:hypothetical protein